MRVTAAELAAQFDAVAKQVAKEPVTVTRDGEDSFVVLSIKEYERLKRRDRQVFAAWELPDEILELIAKTEMSPEHDHLNEELADWKP